MDYTYLRDYAWMSQAAYLGLEEVNTGENTLLSELRFDDYDTKSIFTLEQATTFTDSGDGYSFIDHQENTPTGFSATVFTSNATGDYTIAVRGTEPSATFAADLLRADVLGVVLTGKATINGVSVNN